VFLSGEVEPSTPNLLLKGRLFIMCNPVAVESACITKCLRNG
jgi:hypothetical protein